MNIIDMRPGFLKRFRSVKTRSSNGQAFRCLSRTQPLGSDLSPTHAPTSADHLLSSSTREKVA